MAKLSTVLWFIPVLFISFVLSGCQTPPHRQPALSETSMADRLPKDQRVTASIKSHNHSLKQDFLDLKDAGQWSSRGYFSAQESDRIELLLFRFHTAHHQLNDIADRYRNAKQGSSTGDQALALRTEANQLAFEQAQFLVTTFADDPVAINKLNQAYPRTEIPANTYAELAGALKSLPRRETKHITRRIEDDFDKVAYTAQAELFYRVSRLKKPTAQPLSFSKKQKDELISQLQPGDIILTYTAGYASDVFIPGAFKHGMTYIGTRTQRQQIVQNLDQVVMVGGSREAKKLKRNLLTEETKQGLPANLIEAVAEGVKFSNLDYIMDTHINRMLVLRPSLSITDRARHTGRTFSYLGQEYDFRFDFADASRQVCTEVIYRALMGLNGFDFPLTKRGGHVTLSADDIVNYWLNQQPDSFEFVLYVDEDPLNFPHRANILIGPQGKKRVEELMRELASKK
ncbi:YiiX/YebB-like N1pC/P60 family cysteine hydrolase [Rubritalea spongiae]|uniref:YiiX/YebB-like N1pC/P60 family cysteine hydrolase n=1 Tax=Rubritalea spongiae TaxID=430797 RepID=A0ABW5DZJ7_9BACT